MIKTGGEKRSLILDDVLIILNVTLNVIETAIHEIIHRIQGLFDNEVTKKTFT